MWCGSPLDSQNATLVAHALSQGRTRPWDLVVQEEERYVRGDFWAAFRYAKLADDGA